MRKIKLNSSYSPWYTLVPAVTWTNTFRRDFKLPATTVIGQTYSITINGTTGSVVAASTDGKIVADALQTALDNALNGAGFTGKVQNPASSVYIIVTSPSALTFSSSGTITSKTVTVWVGDDNYENMMLNICGSSNLNCGCIQLYGLYTILYDNDLIFYLRRFLLKAYNTYGFSRVGMMFGDTAGFDKILAFNAGATVPEEKFNEVNLENEFWFGMRVDFRVTSVVVGADYIIEITDAATNNYKFQTVGVLGDTVATIATRLYTQMLSSIPGYVFQQSTTSVTNDTIRVFDRADNLGYAYTITGSISDSLVNLALKDWQTLAFTVKPQTQALGIVFSAYVANPLKSWDMIDATAFYYVDDLECTNYQTTPNERSTVFRNRQLLNVAERSFLNSKVQDFYALHSAEAAFMGSYLQSNGITASEAFWTNLWNTDTFPYKSSLLHQGFVYFDFRNILAYNVQL